MVPQILEALARAIEGGLRVPLVYNCGGYEEVATVQTARRHLRHLHAGFQVLGF